MNERRNKWAEGRRWYDANRAATLVVYGIFALTGMAMGVLLCLLFTGCQPRLPYIPGI
jgi:hypothetical protein